jgi:hypothetical protein
MKLELILLMVIQKYSRDHDNKDLDAEEDEKLR